MLHPQLLEFLEEPADVACGVNLRYSAIRR
jgi:hypothetical protein